MQLAPLSPEGRSRSGLKKRGLKKCYISILDLINPGVILYLTMAVTVLSRLSQTTIIKCHKLSGLDSRRSFSHSSQVLGVYEGASMVGLW